MTTNIINFWKNNSAFWISHKSKQKTADESIKNAFWKYDWTKENIIGQIIYLDQFTRHFSRLQLLTELEVEAARNTAVEIAKSNVDVLIKMDEIEIIFALMPFKHVKQYDFIFEFIHNKWLPLVSKKIIDFSNLQKFYIDSYRKAFTFDTVIKNLITQYDIKPYDPSLICDYYPEKYTKKDWKIDNLEDSKIVNLLKIDGEVVVSLSGGVDSMVILAILKYNGVNVSAVHIVYGNREESEGECAFVANFCNKINVKLSIYKIKWIRRDNIDRQFYEDMTRNLRFFTYRAVSEGQQTKIVMGHIKDDVIENIWTNIANCHHLDNLKKMSVLDVQQGVRIMRPLLNIDKKDIYAISESIGIPYLKNTTPKWSNRGKFRENFHKTTIMQYGEGIDSKMIEFAEAIEKQNNLITLLLYKPIYESFTDNYVNITTAINAKIDANCWIKIFEHICYNNLNISRPSTKCVKYFTSRIYESLDKLDKLNIEMSNNLKIQIIKNNQQYFMKFMP